MALHRTTLIARLRARVRNAPEGSFVSLVRQLREDYWTHGELLMPGFHAIAAHRLANWLPGAPLPARLVVRPLTWAMYVWARNVYGIELPATARVGRRVRIAHQSGIVIHWNARIGNDCIIRQNVTIGAPSSERIEHAATLGNGVELGAGAAIIGRVTIGDGARIGPNTVIMTNVPAGATVFAANARVIQMVRRPAAVPVPHDQQSNTA
jgi:serine O-acetyltransferase